MRPEQAIEHPDVQGEATEWTLLVIRGRGSGKVRVELSFKEGTFAGFHVCGERYRRPRSMQRQDVPASRDEPRNRAKTSLAVVDK